MATMKSILAAALVIATATVLGGCATRVRPAPPSDYELRAQAGMMTPFELCYRQVSGGYSAVLGQAVAHQIVVQKIDCRDHLPMVQAKMQADAAARQQWQQRSLQQTETALKLLDMSRPPPPAVQPLPQPSNCYSTVQGNVIRTNCW